MKLTQLAATSTLTAALLAAGTAFAAGPTNAEYFPFDETKIAKPTGDKVVADKGEASTRTMGATGNGGTMGNGGATSKGGTTVPDQSNEIMMYLKAGG